MKRIKLLVFPLAILVVLSLLSMTGIADTTLGNVKIGGDPSQTIYYDSGGHAVIYANNTVIGENGYITGTAQWGTKYAYWSNDTWNLYPLYWDTSAEMPIEMNDIGQASPNMGGLDFSVGSSLGLIVLVVGVMALGVVVGLRVLGTGTSEESVSAVIKGTAFIALWGVFSVLALDLITLAGDVFMPIIYFVLTTIYTLGILNQIGHPGDD